VNFVRPQSGAYVSPAKAKSSLMQGTFPKFNSGYSDELKGAAVKAAAWGQLLGGTTQFLN
jgi:hypothetical protein